MIITFQSQAAGDVMMFGDVARKLMALMGKDPADQGILTVEQLPNAITRLKAAVTEDKARHAGLREEDMPAFEESTDGSKRAYVSLARRAIPLIELLEWSLKKKVPVVWGM